MDTENKVRFGYVYITTNLVNGKKYIGQHVSPNFDKNYKGSGAHIKKAFKKYGKTFFDTEVLEWCSNQEELNEKEVYWIDKYNAVKSNAFYNILIGGYSLKGMSNPNYGKHPTEETRKKMSESQRKKKLSDEAKKHISEGHIGTRHSEETKKKMSCSAKGEKNPNYGKHPSEETRKKMSKVRKGERNPFYKHHHTEDTRQKMKDAWTIRRTRGKKIWMNNGTEEKQVLISEVEKYSNCGYAKGRKSKREANNDEQHDN